ncbi:ribosome silencing factor [Ancylobacter defluvii]|uniref:Ribosomal silencing factor RsfS n=1 Tax=Ancylobacter defluvii TaxID=1282440 RepID=A0A9W6NC36_9HYPH|nr:ribosome silencing factor [Ancylobacter defluvii]MBS7587075.1 ribosome silencing factor [Ancylobacter defluvii]GLK85378.1 ribosomal silencing factor RsfS [Ancylobacter defluvii]
MRGSGPLSSLALSAAAPTSPAAAPVSEARYDADEILALVLARLDDDKAEDVISIDLRGKTTIADHMVVASGRSQRHVGALADHLVEALKQRGVKGIRVEGQPACDWVLIDASDVIVHLFQPEVRAFYNIEKMWAGGRPDAAGSTSAKSPRG